MKIVTKEGVSRVHPKPKQKTRFLRTLAIVLASVTTLILVALAVSILRLNVLPTKFLVPILVFLGLMSAFVLVFALIKKFPKSFKIVSIVFSIIFSVVGVFGFLKLEDTLAFFSSNFGAATNVSVYNIMVSADSDLFGSSDLSTLKVHVLRDLTSDQSVILQELSTSLKIRDTHFSFDNTVPELIDFAKSSPENLIALNAGAYESFLQDNSEEKDSLKLLTTVEIKTDAEIVEKSVDITETPFVVYISGIDTRTGTLPDRSLSDVNIVAVVNPLVKKILLVSIPRDYYVHIPGTPENSLGDKLTHAGTIGGVVLSKNTVAELLDTEINYYIRVNFYFVQNLVNSVGGITVYSDVDYSFSTGAYVNGADTGKCYFNPGDNFVDGICALAFARERKSYASGDRHRGENQEQVISRVLEKLTSSTTLLTKYSDILGALSGTFETNFSTDDISKFVRAQLSDMKGWSVSSYNLDGSTGGGYTYSYPAQVLSVMYPNDETVATAKLKITELLAE